jgi:hypothetical protein
MARAKEQGNGRLEEAMAVLLQNTATLVQTQAAFVASMAENNRRWAESERNIMERFSRVEAILIEHNRILQALPDAIREKIGFKVPNQPLATFWTFRVSAARKTGRFRRQ